MCIRDRCMCVCVCVCMCVCDVIVIHFILIFRYPCFNCCSKSPWQPIITLSKCTTFHSSDFVYVTTCFNPWERRYSKLYRYWTRCATIVCPNRCKSDLNAPSKCSLCTKTTKNVIVHYIASAQSTPYLVPMAKRREMDNHRSCFFIIKQHCVCCFP